MLHPVLHQPIAIDIHFILNGLVNKVFLYLCHIDDIVLNQFLKFGIVDIALQQTKYQLFQRALSYFNGTVMSSNIVICDYKLVTDTGCCR